MRVFTKKKKKKKIPSVAAGSSLTNLNCLDTVVALGSQGKKELDIPQLPAPASSQGYSCSLYHTQSLRTATGIPGRGEES